MSTAPVIDDDEVVLIRIPPGTLWTAPGPRITSKNFQLRPHEDGISVSRKRFTSREELLALVPGDILSRMGSIDEWQVAEATVGSIRRLGFEVVPDPTDDDAGHALIITGAHSFASHAWRRKLAKLFRFTDS